MPLAFGVADNQAFIFETLQGVPHRGPADFQLSTQSFWETFSPGFRSLRKNGLFNSLICLSSKDVPITTLLKGSNPLEIDRDNLDRFDFRHNDFDLMGTGATWGVRPSHSNFTACSLSFWQA